MEARYRDTSGFTLIELLIVVVILGILAAISVGQFGSVKEDALNASAKNDLRNMLTAQENYFTQAQAYTDATVAAGGRVDLNLDGTDDFSAGQGVSVQATAYSNGVQITAKHGSSPDTWCVNSSQSAASGGVGVIIKAASC